VKYHFVFVSSSEDKVVEFDSDDDPPNVGEYVQLPLGQNKEICRYLVTDVYYAPASSNLTVYYIEVQPA
jgi:hypothetical protein